MAEQKLETPAYVEDPLNQNEKTETAAHILADELFPHFLLICIISFVTFGSLFTMCFAIGYSQGTDKSTKILLGGFCIAAPVFSGFLTRIARGKKEVRSIIRYASERSPLKNKHHLG